MTELTSPERKLLLLIARELSTQCHAQNRPAAAAEIDEAICATEKEPEAVESIGVHSVGLQSRAEWEICAQMRHVPLDWLGKEFVARGVKYRITGASRNPAYNVKMPLKGVRIRDGMPFKFGVQHVKACLMAQAIPVGFPS